MPKIKFHSTFGQNRDHGYEKCNSRLHMAVFLGELKLIKNLCDSGEDMNQLNRKGDTPLHHAIIHDKPKVVKMLLDLGASISTHDRDKKNPLEKAIILGKNSIVKIIIQSVGFRNIPDFQGSSLTTLATHYCHMHILETLLKFGAGINEYNTLRNTPLHCAVFNGNYHMTKLLLEHGANPNIRDHDSNTPMHLAVSRGKRNIVEILIQYKGSVNALDRRLYSPLHVAAKCNKWNIIRTLVLAGADIEAFDEEFNTPLHVAARCNNFKEAEALIHLGARVDARNLILKTPLHIALFQDNMKLIEMLIQRSKDLDYTDSFGCDPLEISLRNCKPKVLEKLIEGGAPIRQETQYMYRMKKISHTSIASRYCQKIFIEAFKKLKDDYKKNGRKDLFKHSSLTENDEELIYRHLNFGVSLSDLLETVKKFIKYEILYFGEESKMYKSWLSTRQRREIYPSLLPYFESCIKEVSCMSDKIIHQGITFYQFVTKVRNSELLQHASLAQDYINHILDIQYTNAYPIYRNVIASRIQKHFLKQELLKYVFYTRISSRKKIFVDNGSLSVLSDYLSNLDILNLILAISNKK